MTDGEKYQWFVEHLGIIKFHPFQNNYEASFATFGDLVPDEIWYDAEKWFKQSDLYKESETCVEGMGAESKAAVEPTSE